MDTEMSGEASGWKPIDFVTRAQREALLAITTVLMGEMKREWGDRWLEELNSLVSQPPSPDTRSVDPRSNEPLKLVNGKLDWDLARMTRSVRVLRRKLSFFSTPEMKEREDRIRFLTETVRDTRNHNAHPKASLNYNDLQSAKKQLNGLIEYVTLVAGAEASKSIKAISAEMIAWVERRVAEPEKTSVIDPADIAQIKAMLLELHREQKAAKEEKKEQSQGAQAKRDRTGDSDNTTSAEQTSMKSEPAELHAKVTPLRRRRNPIPAARNGLVLFPAVVASDETKSELCIVSCDLFQPTHQMSSVFLPIGLEVAQANLCYSIIQNARQDEDNADLSIATVRARFDPNEFQGPSFGLATAIADRSVRYGFSESWTGRHVIATGEIIKGGQGEVGPIDGFEAKVRLLEREAPPRSLFIFPKANLDAASAEILEALRRAEASGAFSWKAVSHVRELEELFADPAVTAPLAAKGMSNSEPEGHNSSGERTADLAPVTRGYKKLMLSSVAAGIVLLAGLYGAGYLRDQFRVDPVLEQANEEHLIVLKRLSQQVVSSPDDAGLCQELVAAAEKTGRSIDAAPGVNDGTLGKAVADCSEALTQSDRRWAALATSINVSDTGSPSASGSILDARSALTAFDLSRLSEEGKAALMQQTEERGRAFAASDARLNSLAEAAKAVMSERTPDLDQRLIAAVSDLDDDDRRRLNAEQQGYLSLASDAAGRLSASERRLSALSSAYARLLVGNSEASRQSFRTAVQAIAE